MILYTTTQHIHYTEHILLIKLNGKVFKLETKRENKISGMYGN